MGLLDWLRKDTGDPVIGDSAFPDFLEIHSHNFFGLFSRSPNRRYTLAWRDADETGSRGGARSSGLGQYFLLQDRNILVGGRMERPNDGKVADNGTFIPNDWEFSSGLGGVFRAFRADGKQIVSRPFKANLFNNGLSADGRLAVCQTCNSPDPDDASILAVFDLISGTEVASWRPESGWATFYEFPADGQTVRLGYADGSAFSYAIDGEFLDRVRWAEAELNKGNLFVVERFVKAADATASPELMRRLIGSIDRALSTTRPDEDRTAS
jgi:hypothetical protein